MGCSTRLCKPCQTPNTTIPKTLAALPKSQYATTFSLVSGKKRAFPFRLLTRIDVFRDERGDDDLGFGTVSLEIASESCGGLDLKVRM